MSVVFLFFIQSAEAIVVCRPVKLSDELGNNHVSWIIRQVSPHISSELPTQSGKILTRMKRSVKTGVLCLGGLILVFGKYPTLWVMTEENIPVWHKEFLEFFFWELSNCLKMKSLTRESEEERRSAGKGGTAFVRLCAGRFALLEKWNIITATVLSWLWLYNLVCVVPGSSFYITDCLPLSYSRSFSVVSLLHQMSLSFSNFVWHQVQRCSDLLQHFINCTAASVVTFQSHEPHHEHNIQCLL